MEKFKITKEPKSTGFNDNNKFVEFYGGGKSLLFTYQGKNEDTGVIMISFLTRDLFKTLSEEMIKQPEDKKTTGVDKRPKKAKEDTSSKKKVSHVKVTRRPPIIEYFEVIAQTEDKGGKRTLIWETSNAKEVEISGIGKVELSGSRGVNPLETTTYRLIAKNEGGEITKEATVNVSEVASIPPSSESKKSGKFKYAVDEYVKWLKEPQPDTTESQKSYLCRNTDSEPRLNEKQKEALKQACEIVGFQTTQSTIPLKQTDPWGEMEW